MLLRCLYGWWFGLFGGCLVYISSSHVLFVCFGGLVVCCFYLFAGNLITDLVVRFR